MGNKPEFELVNQQLFQDFIHCARQGDLGTVLLMGERKNGKQKQAKEMIKDALQN